MGSSEAHARRQRIARVRQKQPALVDQLMKDLKKEIGGRQGQTVEQMRRMMGAAATRSFLHRALFKRVAKAFYHWLCGGVDASLMGRLKTALKEEKEFTLELEKHIKYQDEQAEQDRLKAEKMEEEHGVAGNELNSKLEFTHQNLEKMTRIVKKTRKKALRRILKKFIKRESKWGFKTWKRRVYGVLGKHRKMMKAATWFTNKSVRKVWRSWQVYIKMCKSDKRKNAQIECIYAK